MMERFLFRCIELLLKALAYLPLSVLYVFADCMFVLVFYVVRYRRRTVRDNLIECFPDKDLVEIKKIERQFYRNFADYTVETIKLFHISNDDMEKRMRFENIELIDRLVAEGRSIVVYFSHCGNWEWAPSVTLHTSRRPGDGVEYCQVYRPLNNHSFDAMLLRLRSRFGSLSFPKSHVLRDLIRLKRDGICTVTGFMSDQKPSHGDPTVPMMFLNRPTAFIGGTEMLARKLGMAAIYWDMEKPSRGHYKIVCRLICDNVADTEPTVPTRTYADMLQTTIERNPSIWLWSHKRWKYPVKME